MIYVKSLVAVAAIALVSGCSKNSDTGAGGTADTQSYSSSSGRDSAASTRSSDVTTAQPNNTGKNVRDRNDSTLTPEDQGGSDADRDMTRRIRRAVTSNDRFSADAKNIKIITTNGKVTLRGPVNDEQEKSAIASLAQQNGAASVDDQLEVKDNTKKDSTTK
jgi:hyperosmotically inducible periplasmic protein